MENTTNPDEDLTSFLRQGAGRELAEEAAADEEQTEALRQRQMDMTAVIEDAAHRGERATAEMGETVISGPILATGTDYLTIQLPDQEADIRLDFAVWSFVPGQDGWTSAGRSGMSFVGRLKEHAAENRRLRIELSNGSPVMGLVKSVSQDHIRLEDPDGRLAYVPLGRVRAIIRSTSH